MPYCPRYDAAYNKNGFTESKCGDPECEYCLKRPNHPDCDTCTEQCSRYAYTVRARMNDGEDVYMGLFYNEAEARAKADSIINDDSDLEDYAEFVEVITINVET